MQLFATLCICCARADVLKAALYWVRCVHKGRGVTNVQELAVCSYVLDDSSHQRVLHTPAASDKPWSSSADVAFQKPRQNSIKFCA